MDGGAVWFQQGPDGGEVDDSSFVLADEWEESLIHLPSHRQRMRFRKGKRTYFQCPVVIRLQRQLDILHRILRIHIQPRIINQRIHAPLFPLYQLNELADGILVGDIQLGIFYLALGVRRTQFEVYAGAGGGVEYDGLGKGKDALADCLAYSAVLARGVVRADSGDG